MPSRDPRFDADARASFVEHRAPDAQGAEQMSPPHWLLHLEQAHDWLRRAARALQADTQPVMDLRPAAQALEDAHGHLYAAFDFRDDRLSAVELGSNALDQAIATLQPAVSRDPAVASATECLSHARAALTHAAERLAVLAPQLRPQVPELRAGTQNTPALHAIDRPSIVPAVRVIEPPPPPAADLAHAPAKPGTFQEMEASFEALRQRHDARRAAHKAALQSAARPKSTAPAERPAVPPGFAKDYRPAISELAFVHDKTRECFEEIAMLGTQRAPLLGDPWRSSLVLEQRMLYCLDAIAALGPAAIARLEPLVMDSPVQDPSRLFGIAFVLGCTDGRDALAAAERVFFALEPADPKCATQFAAALKLVPHPLLPLALRTLLGSPEATHRAVAIDVLGYRGMATVEELARAARDEPPVAAAALPHYALTGHEDVFEAIEAAESTPALRESAWLAMMLSGYPQTRRALARGLDDAALSNTAALWLALAGDSRDAEQLLSRALAAPAQGRVAAVGWAGAGAAIPKLIGLLGHGKPDVQVAAAYALERITGAGLYEEAEVDPEEIDVPEPPDPQLPDLAKPPPLAITAGDPRHAPEPPARETIERPTIDPDRWRELWRERHSAFAPHLRYRRGYPYTPLISLRELDGVWPATPGERRSLQRELIVRTGSFVRTDPHDFVVVQESAIQAWEPHAARASSSPGAWIRPTQLPRSTS